MTDRLKKYQITDEQKQQLEDDIKNGNYLFISQKLPNGLSVTTFSKKAIDMLINKKGH